jgi:hypothetical protein
LLTSLEVWSCSSIREVEERDQICGVARRAQPWEELFIQFMGRAAPSRAPTPAEPPYVPPPNTPSLPMSSFMHVGGFHYGLIRFLIAW